MTALATHAGKLERWLGKEEVEHIADKMRDWHGPPIAVAGVPGRVYASRGGDFRGRIAEGGFASLLCKSEDVYNKLPERARRWALKQSSMANTGFASFSDFLAEATGGKRREAAFNKAGSTGVVAATNSLWRVGAQPAAGSAAAAAPGGTVPTNATTGALLGMENCSPDTRHIVTGWSHGTVGGNTLLAYDRIFAVAKTMNSTATEAVTGVPTRYQSTTPGDDYAGGNFVFFECGTALPATAHNWTVCTYTDQDGNTGATLPSLTGNVSNIINRLDHPTGQWFAPLASGDSGIKNLTQLQLSAAVASGAVDAVIGHPLAWLPVYVANFPNCTDGMNTAVNLVRVFDGACIAFLEMLKSATTATTYNGSITTVAG